MQICLFLCLKYIYFQFDLFSCVSSSKIWKITDKVRKNSQLGQNRSGQVRTGRDRLGQVGTGWDRLGRVGTERDRSGQLGTGQVRSGMERSGQDGTGRDRKFKDLRVFGFIDFWI